MSKKVVIICLSIFMLSLITGYRSYTKQQLTGESEFSSHGLGMKLDDFRVQLNHKIAEGELGNEL